MYGIFNQKGFIMPLTMMVCFLFPLIILSEIEMYMLEQRFYIEKEEMEKLQSLTQVGIQDLFNLIEEQTIIEPTAGRLSYPYGTVDYSIEPMVNNLVHIQGTCLTDKLRKQFFIATVNKETKAIESWVEE